MEVVCAVADYGDVGMQQCLCHMLILYKLRWASLIEDMKNAIQFPLP